MEQNWSIPFVATNLMGEARFVPLCQCSYWTSRSGADVVGTLCSLIYCQSK